MQIHGDTVRFGVHSGQQYSSFDDMLELWQRAEELGYDWVSLFDHLRPPIGGPDGPCFEGTTVLAALAARTSRIRCALLVSAVTWRHPAMAANIAATLDHVSGGRLEFGVGAAGADLGYEQYGIPFPSAGERLDMLTESCEIMRRLWTEKGTDFTGKHFRLTGAHVEPKPLQSRLPLVIGGEGERRMLRIVAEHADIWNTLAATPEVYRHKLDVLARHCADVGRDPRDVRKSVTFRALLVEDERELPARREALARILPPDSPVWPEYLVFGTPEQCAERLQPYLDMGVRDFVLGARPPVDWRTVELFADRVVPLLR
ncbi:TIGR03560 family F420-dependent LLM class oxidoreductase [Kitasatospora sp. NPDC085879]|uniref:TIGR03560 family F420-dependent LLM class oxidoreductase n=1 Tax=Kitasatospora sp. NPDC085879 TaxID=3154769 RepID=UPI003445925D